MRVSDLVLSCQKLPYKLRLVVLDCPYDTIQNIETQKLFARMAALKIAGYKKEYPDGVLPLDTSDFIATHLLLCEETDDGLRPIMGFKSVMKEKCEKHRVAFPVFNLMEGIESAAHQSALEKLISTAVVREEQVAYNGSWTIDRKVREDRVLAQFCIDMTALMLIRHYYERGIENIVAGAVVRFHVDDFKKFMGFGSLKDEQGRDLPCVQCKFVFQENVKLMHLRNFNDAALRWTERNIEMWRNRIVISAAGSSQIRKAA